MFRFPCLAVVYCAHLGISLLLVYIPIHLFSSKKVLIILDEFIVKQSCVFERLMHVCGIHTTSLELNANHRSTLVKLIKMLFRFIVSAWLFGDNFFYFN